MQRYDAIVLGVGGIGGAALCELARRGTRCLGIDRFNPPHDRGSTHGQSRVIRQAYFEHPDYVPLLLESYRGWESLQQQAGRQLLYKIGLIQVGPADGVVVPGVLRAAEEHGLAVESLDAAQIAKRWPGLRVLRELVGVFEPAAGYLLVENCVRAHLDAARACGAELLTDTEVLEWTADEGGVRVRTGREEVGADRLIVAAGAWAGQMLADLKIPLTVRRQALFWFDTNSTEYDLASGFPVYLFELAEAANSRVSPQLGDGSFGETALHGGVFYGFPKLDSRGVKFAEHTAGRTVADPLQVDRSLDPLEVRKLTKVLADFLPGVSHKVLEHTVCLYTMSPDENFIVDIHPQHSNVAFAAGLSGHGFKFAPVLGRALADLALDGGTRLPIGFLSLGRFAK